MKYNTESFIKKAKEIHGDKYDYSKTEYVNSKTKIIIICPEHGEFKQEPRHHLSGQGCIFCGYKTMKEKITNTIHNFILKAKKTHEINYDYTKVVYEGINKPVCIGCPQHGDFWMTPHQFLKGSNCPKCSCRAATNREKFLTKAKEKFGDKFTYNNIEIKNLKDKISVICPLHGDFTTSAISFLTNKNGCPKCSIENTKHPAALNNEKFIKKAIKIHGKKYNYENINYINTYTSVVIFCPEHGPFKQKPQKHLQGHGCPKCGDKHNKTELKIFKKLLQEFNGVEYQKPLKDLVNQKTQQRVDFYIPDYNIVIEYQGKQHFEPVKRFGGEDEFLLTKKRDELKYKLCLKNNIIIKYLSFEKKAEHNFFEYVYCDIDKLIKDIKMNRME